MRPLTACPGCGATSIRAFSSTPIHERNGDIHYAQSHCRRCDLVFSNPVAEPEDLERYYRSSYYQECGPLYAREDPGLDDMIAAWERDEAAGLQESVLPYVSGGRFLEIGAGYGRLLLGARRVGFDVAGVEPSEHASRFARDVVGLEEVRHGMFDPEAWPVGSFDVVYAFHVIEHVVDLHAFLDGIQRLLRPGGLVVLSTESHHNAWVQVRRARSWMKGAWLPEFQTSNHHTYYFSDRSLGSLLERHRLRVLKSRVYTHALAEKLPHYRFRSWRSKLAFYAMHYADDWTGRGNRLLVWARKDEVIGTSRPSEWRNGNPSAETGR